MPLRDYQQQAVNATRDEFRQGHRSVLMQLATGGGKTPIVAEFVRLARRKNLSSNCWFVVPRNSLLEQASETFSKWNIPHGRIDAKTQESGAFPVHVVSKDTLMRRFDKIKIWPDLLIFDEAHLYYDAQEKIISNLPERSRYIGVTATPERLDGKPLSALYKSIVYGPSIVELTGLGYLAPIRYYAPALDGLDTITKRGHEYDADELETLLKERAIYGDMLRYYREYGRNRPTLVFCRSIKSAENTAHRFREAGYRAEPIEGRMPRKRQQELIQALRDKKLDVLTSADLVTYGVDIPALEVIIMLRPTQSRALYMQMIGRGIRPGKKDCVILDHVNNLRTHKHPYDDRMWNFDGRVIKKKKRECANCEFCEVDDMICRRFDAPAAEFKPESCPYYTELTQRPLKLCPACFLYTDKSPCTGCGAVTKKTRKELAEKDAELVEQVGAVKIFERPDPERLEIENRISELTEQAKSEQKLNHGIVAELLEIADSTKRNVMWVYHQLARTEMMIDVSLLHAIAKAKGYSNGWAWHKQQSLRVRK